MSFVILFFQNGDKETDLFSMASTSHVEDLLNPGADNTSDTMKLLSESSEWRSKFTEEAGFFTPESRPPAIRDLYDQCEALPKLHMLQVKF